MGLCAYEQGGRAPEDTKVRAIVIGGADQRYVRAAKAVHTRRALAKARCTRAQGRNAVCVGEAFLAIRHLQGWCTKVRQATTGGIKCGEGFHEFIQVHFGFGLRAIEVQEDIAILRARVVNLARA